jgi:hypothetical protein
MMGRGVTMGSGTIHSGMMMRVLFAMMDSDDDGTISLQEFQTAHERIFKAMDIKMASLPWRKSRPSCTEPGHRFRASNRPSAGGQVTNPASSARAVRLAVAHELPLAPRATAGRFFFGAS